ncbi:MAG: potassium-transporting ATPase subunit KdpA [Pseudomonadota bacterium]
MNHSATLQLSLFFIVLLILAWPLGKYLSSLMDGRLAARWTALQKIDHTVMRLLGSRLSDDYPWWRYAGALVVLKLLMLVFAYAALRWQSLLPLNPNGMSDLTPDLAFNTAVSFLTNTNWQSYSGESTMSNFSQMLVLAVQNFMSAAIGIVVAVALVRGFTRSGAQGIGNPWLDLWRVHAWLLLPLSLLFAVFLVGQGVVQSMAPSVTAELRVPLAYEQPKLDSEGQAIRDATGKPLVVTASSNTQTLPLGPVASQEAIKMLGTNGGGFYNANSAHPFENPTPLSNFAQMIAIFLIPAALVFMFGRMVSDQRQGIAILAAMVILFCVMFAVAYTAESQSNPLLIPEGMANDGNLEGKEVRFGIVASSLFATITTAASCGAVNAMHDSFMPLGGLVPMWLIQLGEVVFGGVGSGLYGMLLFALLAVFLAGLMIGRTPEYLGKKIESFEMKMVSIAILGTPLLVLGGTAIGVISTSGLAGMANPAAHGFSEVLYAFSSAANNNGSAFAGLSANTPFYNYLLALAMWFGRFLTMIPVLAIAGSFAAKPRLAASSGSMPTHGPLFVLLLIATVVIVGALTYIPALSLGPIVEQLQLAH